MPAPIITLLTDFGTADGYVAAMKGVIANVAPESTVWDASHEIPPGDIRAAAWTLRRYWQHYPPDTVHIVVVDPGVGGERSAVAVHVGSQYIVAPDNGVLSGVFEDREPDRIIELISPEWRRDPVSYTFHGRDIFAPAGAHLAAGLDIDSLGPEKKEAETFELPKPERRGGIVYGEVMHVDRFGNLITNIPFNWIGQTPLVRVEGKSVGPLKRFYADVEPGEALAVIGSMDLLEISVRDGSATEFLGHGRGASVSATAAV